MEKPSVEATEKARKAFKSAKLGLIGLGPNLLQTPSAAFFGHLAFRLQDIPTHAFVKKVPGGTKIEFLPTAATDGSRLFYNPEFVNNCTGEELVGLICHEIMHCVLGHHVRLRFVDRNRAQIACDLAINPTVLEAGFKMPLRDKIQMPGEREWVKLKRGLSAEEYYPLVVIPPGKGGDKDGPGSAGDIGSVFIPDELAGDDEADSDAQDRASEQEWKMAVAEAAIMARQRGEIPGELGVLIESFLATPRLDWRTILAQFLTTYCRDDYSWLRPSRRSHLGAVLPQLYSDRPGHVVVAIDTSGSVGDDQLREFLHELGGIMQCMPAKVSVVWCDAKVHRVDEWHPTDGGFKPRPVGRGGTSHKPVFKWVEKLEEPPICVVCLTDLYTDFPDKHPDVPVLWVSVGAEEAPFGTVVKI